MKLLRFGALFAGLALSLSLVHTAAAAYGDDDSGTAPYVPDPLIIQYAEELSEYTGLAYYRGENAARYIDFKIRFPDCSWETVITDVDIGLDTSYYTNAAEIADPGSVDVLVNKYNYLPKSFVPDDLEKIDSRYCFKTEMLTHDARVAFEQLCADARSLGYTLYATSSYRSYARQLELYQSYGIPDVTTARPGYSEHQTGLAVDVIHTASASNSGLAQSDVYKWYVDNACKYGFIIRYQDNGIS
jgi:D-alanyl-D-alanine carboxypeptidase